MVLNESLVLSVVKDDSSELVKRDQSLDVASEKSMLTESAYLSSFGRIIPSLEMRRPFPKFSEVKLTPVCLCCPCLEVFWVLGAACNEALATYVLGGRGNDLNVTKRLNQAGKT